MVSHSTLIINASLESCQRLRLTAHLLYPFIQQLTAHLLYPFIQQLDKLGLNIALNCKLSREVRGWI